ncbi:unnamed protein product [Vitrella brassicaformis CCMP3155]|uniref:Metallo-beta-lactamase domain-containing protein n=2 Tax=Vitrella brassicaformis TaxID=1169539 RepID=A0A0G4FZ52_VITBC|nr:unnamed protein product [Vitrella brassicaformis CCMP3155]|mmetsp:Transcript_22429/g.64094  ORF Transcript_22429/g.64094 Transcript_22429/m.64094 type:complete len:430 (-) Transcript_22429:845-2134(-)|eukprot:CEM20900.1 unnamed protein product [Vitrella brassicaformis CCMP3155]
MTETHRPGLERPPGLTITRQHVPPRPAHDAADGEDCSTDGILFVGTGVSSALPHLEHVLSPNASCPTCLDAANNPSSRNRRNNVSLLIMHRGKNILIDVGKTFRDAAIRVLRPNAIYKIDALLLTHCHADAVMGIDDVRDLQRYERPIGPDGKKRYLPVEKLPTYLSQKTLDSLSKQFHYIIKASQATEPLERKVTVLDFHLLKDDPSAAPDLSTFEVKGTGLVVTALPVWHGKPYVCLGFTFAFDSDERVVYLSDVSEVPHDVRDFILSLGPIKILVIDAIHWEKQHFSHITLQEALQYVLLFQPEEAYFVGMMCDIEHDDATEKLNQWLDDERSNNSELNVKKVALAYDGLKIPLRCPPLNNPSSTTTAAAAQRAPSPVPVDALKRVGQPSALQTPHRPICQSPGETPENTPLPPVPLGGGKEPPDR